MDRDRGRSSIRNEKEGTRREVDEEKHGVVEERKKTEVRTVKQTTMVVTRAAELTAEHTTTREMTMAEAQQGKHTEEHTATGEHGVT